MKKLISTVLTMTLFAAFTFAADPKVTPEIKFIKGNIQDKIASVKEDDKEKAYGIAVKAVDFVIENIELLKDDRDIAGLAIAGILAYPEAEYNSNTAVTVQKFGSIFYGLKDKNVRISIFDKLLFLSKSESKPEAVDFINNYLQESAQDKVKLTEVEKRAIINLSQLGNNDSFRILYSIVRSKIWPDFDTETKKSLLAVTEKSMQEVISIINDADFEEMKFIYSLFVEDSKISSSCKAEIAEYLLNNSMISVRDSSKITKDISDFQLNNCRVLYENNWTRSNALMLSYFDVAKSEYKAGFLTDNDFALVISYVEKLASKDSVKIFTAYLGELNKGMENGNLPAETIVSAVIQALGALGDKSAFDCLLYTTYLPYPEEIVAQARSALSSLKW